MALVMDVARIKIITSRAIETTGTLKVPKCGMFVAEIFIEIRPVWVGDLEARPKNLKSLCLGPYITLYFLGFLL
jgi:hypothetical protein